METLKNENILVVDSDKYFAEMLISSLKKLGSESKISWVSDEVGLKKIIATAYTFIFIDSLMLIKEHKFLADFFNLNKLCNLIVLIPFLN